MGRHYTDPLEFLLDGVAESVRDDGSCTNLTPSPELRALWTKWGHLVNEVLQQFWDANPNLVAVPIETVLNSNKRDIDYDVFQTLAGAGVGIHDGHWDHFFTTQDKYLRTGKIVPLQSLEVFLKARLSRAHQALEMAMFDEASEQCDRAQPRGLKIDTSINGLRTRQR